MFILYFNNCRRKQEISGKKCLLKFSNSIVILQASPAISQLMERPHIKEGKFLHEDTTTLGTSLRDKANRISEGLNTEMKKS